MNAEFVLLEGFTQSAFQHQPFHGGRIHVRVVNLQRTAALVLGPVKRGIGIADQVNHVVAIARVQGNSRARAHVDLMALKQQRVGNGFLKQAGGGDDLGAQVPSGVEIVKNHAELITREPAHDRRVGQQASQPVGECLKTQVPSRVAEGVVDLLELVHVEVDQG